MEAGDRATATPAAPAPGATAAAKAAPVPRTAQVFLIDAKGLMGKGLRTPVMEAVEKDLNALYDVAPGKDYLKMNQGARFVVKHRETGTSRAERGAFGALQYPIYLLNAHTSDAASVSDIESIMKDHGIRDAGRGKLQYDEARDGWKAKTVEGLGIQPLEGYRKVGFIKADRIHAARGDLETLFRNIIKHELGHMFGQTKHTDQVMRRAILLADASLGYSEAHARQFQTEIARLQRKTEAELQANYERANR